MSNMKKSTTKVIILNIFGYLFFLAGVGVLVWFFIKHPLDHSLLIMKKLQFPNIHMNYLIIVELSIMGNHLP